MGPNKASRGEEEVDTKKRRQKRLKFLSLNQKNYQKSPIKNYQSQTISLNLCLSRFPHHERGNMSMACKTVRLLQSSTKNVNQKSLSASASAPKPALTTIRDMYQNRGGAFNNGNQKNNSSKGLKDSVGSTKQKTTINDMYKYQKRK